jgi:hypothetical protein
MGYGFAAVNYCKKIKNKKRSEFVAEFREISTRLL